MRFDGAFEAVVTIATGIIGVAILAVIVSRNANTAGVLRAAGSAFSQSLGAATAPVTGGGVSPFPYSGMQINPIGSQSLEYGF